MSQESGEPQPSIEIPLGKAAQKSIRTQPFTRREVVFGTAGAVLGVVTGLAAGIGLFATENPLYLRALEAVIEATQSGAPIVHVDEDQTKPVQEIIGSFLPYGFKFSDVIRKYNLVPEVFTNGTSVEERHRKALFYFQKFQLALIDLARSPLSDTVGLTMGRLGVVSEENFPIAFSPTTTMRDIVVGLTSDVESRQVYLNPELQLNANYGFGTVNEPAFIQEVDDNSTQNSVQINTKIYVGDDALRYFERDRVGNYVYNQYTDAQWALKLLHEYCHRKQGQALFRFISEDPNLFDEVLKNPSKADKILDSIIAAHDYRIKQTLINAKVTPQTYQRAALNEAQANTISQLALYQLFRMNNGINMPGFSDDDPLGPNAIRPTLLSNFTTNVLPILQNVPMAGPLNPHWLVRHSNWG